MSKEYLTRNDEGEANLNVDWQMIIKIGAVETPDVLTGIARLACVTVFTNTLPATIIRLYTLPTILTRVRRARINSC